MPADIEACVRQMQGKSEIDEPWAFCQWAKENSRGPFAHGEVNDTPAAVLDFAERKKDALGRIIIPDVEVFEAGDWQGERYTTADLDAMVRNFVRFQDQVEPPVVIGHEEDQELLQNTGIPAAGWVVGLRRRGNKLFADMSQVFPEIADLVEGGAYKHVSAEVYPRDNPPEGVPADGCMLRRVALLGGSLPHIKSLADLPRPVRRHAERRGSPHIQLHPRRRVWHPTTGAWACFAEVRKMADDATEQIAVAAIKERYADLPEALIDSFTPEQLKIIAGEMGGGTGASPGEEGPGATPAMQEPPAPGKSREEMIAELVALGEDEAALSAMTDADLETLYREKVGQATPMSEPPAVTPDDPYLLESDPMPDPTPPPVKRQPAKVTVTQQYSEQRVRRLEARLKAAEARQAEQERLSRRRQAEEQRKLVVSFCDRLVKEGKVTPADVEFSKQGQAIGPLAFALTTADAVRKFSEQDNKTALELLMDKLDARPARRFAEQVPDPVQGNAGGALAPERRRQLLGHTRAGRALLAKEEKEAAGHRAFAETLGHVINQRLGKSNGQ